MSHNFLVYIDESGDEGFKFLADGQSASSEWFILSALTIRTHSARRTLAYWREFTKSLEAARGPIHFADLSHDQCVALTHKLSKTEDCWLVSVCVNKRALPMPHTLSQRGQRRLYFYATRLLLERVSWLARAETPFLEHIRPAKLMFSHCKKLSYARLQIYLAHLKTRSTSVIWRYLDVEGLQVRQAGQALGLRMADIAASGIRRGLELSRYGFCEPRFAVLLKDITYNRMGNYLSYGLKFLPKAPAEEPARDKRYKWIQKYTLI